MLSILLVQIVQKADAYNVFKSWISEKLNRSSVAMSMINFSPNSSGKGFFFFLAELFRGMLFKWKGENKKSH